MVTGTVALRRSTHYGRVQILRTAGPLGRCARMADSRFVCTDIYCDVIELGPPGRKAGAMPPAPAFQVALGAAVKARREELGLTQEQLDLRTDLHQRWISNVENGKRNPSYASLRRLAAGLELTVSELAARAEQMENSTDRPVATSKRLPGTADRRLAP